MCSTLCRRARVGVISAFFCPVDHPISSAPHAQSSYRSLLLPFLNGRGLVSSALLAIALHPPTAQSQQPITLTEAVSASVRGPAAVLASLDAAASRARVAIARSITNPTLSASYTENTPRQHADLSLPIDFLYTRSLRVRAAERGLSSAELQLAFQQATARYQVTAAYARAAAALSKALLARGTARDADSLLSMATLRERTGDASRLEVELARINRSDAAIRAAQDSADGVLTVIEVQRLMAMPTDRVRILLADSLARLAEEDTGAASGADSVITGTPLAVAAALREVESRTLSLVAERRRVFGAPAISVGVEAGLPERPGLLPTVGVSLPLPLLDRNRGNVGLATVERDRALALLEIARRDAAGNLAGATRSRILAMERVRQTRELLASADQIAALTLVAYREGEAGLSFVLEATRRARDLRDGYITALAELIAAQAGVRLYSLLAPTS